MATYTPTLNTQRVIKIASFLELSEMDIAAEIEQQRICNELLNDMYPKMEALQIAVVIGAVAVELEIKDGVSSSEWFEAQKEVSL